MIGRLFPARCAVRVEADRRAEGVNTNARPAPMASSGYDTDLELSCVNISRRLQASTPSHQRPARRFDRRPGSTTRSGTRMIVPSPCRSAAASTQAKREIMTAIRAAKAAPRERISPQNGMPEAVPYVYRQQERRNTYAARIARRNAQEWGQPPDRSAEADEASSVAIHTWLRAEILAVSTLPEPNTAS
jgi:hypothetical protein